MLQAACWNEQADRKLREPVCRLHHPFILRCEKRRTVRESEGRQEKCGSEVVIKGETEGGGREIRVDEKSLSFNRERDKGSVSAGGRENVLVREGRCSDSFIHAPDCGGGREKEPRRPREGTRSVCFLLSV